MIYKFQPFDINKQIGKEYNAHCSIVPSPDDWILILDYDCMILASEAYKVIEAAISRYPETVLFGAKCNRVGYSHQRLNQEMSDNDSMRYHNQLAIDQAELFINGECESARGIAGFFMLFRKSYWQQNPFQEEIYDKNNNLFDYNFCRHAIKKGMKVMVIKGVYCWHSYRLLKTPNDTRHLRTWLKDGSYV